MDQLINSMPALLKAAGDVKEVALSVAQTSWNHIAGEGLRNHTAVTDFQNKKLTIAVGDAVWQRQLETMSAQLLFRLNAVMGQGTVKFIEYRVDAKALEGRIAKPKMTEPSSSSAVLPVELVTAASSIKDPKLRRAFLGAANSSLQRRKADR
jgi:Dna[CI] antecedent, DciA